MAAITFGYVDASGANQIALISPSSVPTGTTLRNLVITSWQRLGSPTPVWVDGTPNSLVLTISVRLGISQGQPDGWSA